MFDYKQLEALEMIVLSGSFDGAARRLHLTQSAISQRIRQLEERFGGVLLIRDHPVRPTPAGERLLAHVRQVRQLEEEVSASRLGHAVWQSARIGVNADSLAIGLLEFIAPALSAEHLLLECVVDDEAYTLGLLKAGEVMGCISTHADALPGCAVVPLGHMQYVMVASAQFAAAYFPQGVNRDSLMHAPAVVSGRQDSLHRRYLREQFALEEGAYPCHVIAESHAVFAAAVSGIAYAIVPALQAKNAVQSANIVVLELPAPIRVALFWQYLARRTPALEQLGKAMIDFAKKHYI